MTKLEKYKDEASFQGQSGMKMVIIVWLIGHSLSLRISTPTHVVAKLHS